MTVWKKVNMNNSPYDNKCVHGDISLSVGKLNDNGLWGYRLKKAGRHVYKSTFMLAPGEGLEQAKAKAFRFAILYLQEECQYWNSFLENVRKAQYEAQFGTSQAGEEEQP